MKKLLLLFVMCFVGMMVPQSVFAAADVVVSGTTVTINTSNAGDLKTYLQSATDAQKQAISGASTIVFVGKFSGQDLDALRDAGCCTQKTVNMSEAKFMKPAGQGGNNKTYLFHDLDARNNTNQDIKPNNRCIVGATKYKSAVRQLPSGWHEIREDEIANGQSWQTRNFCADDVNTLNYSYDVYLKLPTTLNYYQLVVTKDENNNETSREWVLIQNPTDGQKSEAMEIESQYTDSNLSSIKQNYSPNQIVKVRPDNCTYKYYTNEASYEFYWQSVAETNDDYQNGAQNTDQWYASIDDAPAPTDYGQWMIAGGTEYVFKGPAEGWIDASQGGNEEYNYDQMSFKNWGTNVKTAITSKHVDPNTKLANNLCEGCTSLTDLTINSGTIHKIAGGDNKPPLEKVTIGNKVAQIGNGHADSGFAKYSTIKEVVFEENGDVPLVIAGSSFVECSNLAKVTIPVRTTLIGKQAFGECRGLKKVEFAPVEEATSTLAPLVIKEEAFDNCNALTDVYVFVDPQLKPMVCEYNAFDFMALDGQSEPSAYDQMATLHFDPNHKEFYKGEWKEGLGFSQTELLAIRGQNNGSNTYLNSLGTIACGSQGSLVDQHSQEAIEHIGEEYKGYTMGYLTNKPANGWQQFAKTGNEIPIHGNFLRSYSTSTAYEIPTYSYTPIVKIYRIWDFDDGYTSEDEGHESEANTREKKAYAKEVTGYIPGNTGLIMVGITDKSVLYNFKVYTGTTRQYPFNDKTTASDAEAECNLLEGNPNSDVDLGPTVTENQTRYRVFGFRARDKKFLRAQPGTVLTKNHAYMKLKNDLFHWKNEKGGTDSDGIDSNNTTQAKISFIYSLDEEEEFGGSIATVIRKAIEDADMEDGEFYTLQGVKVNKPTTKGVYIHNGKKVLVK